MTLYDIHTYVGHLLKNQIEKEALPPQPLNYRDTDTIDSVQAALLRQKIYQRLHQREPPLPHAWNRITSLFLTVWAELGIVTQLAQ